MPCGVAGTPATVQTYKLVDVDPSVRRNKLPIPHAANVGNVVSESVLGSPAAAKI